SFARGGGQFWSRLGQAVPQLELARLWLQKPRSLLVSRSAESLELRQAASVPGGLQPPQFHTHEPDCLFCTTLVSFYALFRMEELDIFSLLFFPIDIREPLLHNDAPLRNCAYYPVIGTDSRPTPYSVAITIWCLNHRGISVAAPDDGDEIHLRQTDSLQWR